MKKKHIITIAGQPGSGKSTTAKRVAAKLGFKHFSSGDLYRELGKEQGIDILRAISAPGVSEKIDRLVDGKLREIGANHDRIVIDSRLAWHWIPSSFKVFLDLDPKIGAQRILKNMIKDRLTTENVPRNPNEYALELQNRLNSENNRYKTVYKIDMYDFRNYDLVVNTAENNVEQAVEEVINDFKNWLSWHS